MMLQRFYHSFALERERLQIPKLRRCGHFIIYLRKRLAVTIWIANIRPTTRHTAESISDKIKDIPPTHKKVKIADCGSVAQALYRYLDAKYNFGT